MGSGIANVLHAMGYHRKAMKFLKSFDSSVAKLSDAVSWTKEVERTVGKQRVKFSDGADTWRWLKD